MLDVVTQLLSSRSASPCCMALVRLIKGPTLPDRVVAMDLIGVLIVSLIVVLAASSHVRATLDAAIVIALIGFVGTLRLRDVYRSRATGMIDVLPRPVAGRLGIRAAGGRGRGADAGCVHAHAGVNESLDAGPGLPARRRGLQFGDLRVVHSRVSIGAFILLTTPVAAHVIARAAYRADVPLWDGTALDERRGAKEDTPHANPPELG